MNQKILLAILCISIFLVPLSSVFQIPGTIVWYSQYIAFIGLGLCLACFLTWQINKPLAVLLAYCVFSYIFVCHQHPRAMLCLMSGMSGIGLICIVSKIKNTRIIYRSMIGMSALQFLLIILQRSNMDPFFHQINHENLSETVGFVGSHNQLGIYYAAVSPFLLQLSLFLFPIALIAIFFTHCSTTAVGLIVGTFFYFACFKYKILWVIAPFLLICVFFWPKFDSFGESFKERINIWKLTFDQVGSGKAVMDAGGGLNHIVTCNPLTGFGLGSFLMISPLTQWVMLDKNIKKESRPQHRYEHAHNDLIEYIFEFGIIGIPILLLIIGDILFKFITTLKTNMLIMVFSSLIAQIVCSFGVYVIHAPVSFFMLCLTIGLFYAEVNHARKSI